jgi:hypothetical protein
MQGASRAARRNLARPARGKIKTMRGNLSVSCQQLDVAWKYRISKAHFKMML